MDDFRLGLGERVFPATFMLLEQPAEVSEPREPGDFFNVFE